MFGKKPEKKQEVFLTKEEEEKINLTIEETFKIHNFREKQNIFKINFSVESQINSGSLKLLEKTENNAFITEGIEIKFNGFIVRLENDNNRISFDNQIKSFDINLLSIINHEKSIIPITFSENQIERTNYFETKLKLDEEFNSDLYIKMVITLFT